MRKFFKIWFWSVMTLVILAFLLGTAGYLYFSVNVADYKGDKQVTFIKQSIKITRDQNAIPHIEAETIEDAYFAVGYTQAQDRLWQMEFHRHIGHGRLSELVGENGLKTDKFLRTIGMHRAAKASMQYIDDATMKSLEAYSAGVNAYLAEDHLLPIEFHILGLDKPKKWQPIDSVVWLKMMAWDLNSTWRKELKRFELSTYMSPKEIAQFYMPYPGEKQFTPPKLEDIYGKEFVDQMKVEKKEFKPLTISSILDHQDYEGVGSNNWVMSGKMTTSGKPILANDPHLGLTAPALWYHMHIKTKDGSINAIGATMPGVPFVILGRNDKIAWGFTNTAPDAQDLYVEKILPNGQYQTEDGSKLIKTVEEVIKVKGGEDIALKVRITDHGPIISDRLERLDPILNDNYAISMRWTALDEYSETMNAAARLSTSQNWQEFQANLSKFNAPQQNVVYADVEGNIGYYAPGAVPLRHQDNKLNGNFPSPGWQKKYDWQGYLKDDQLPRIENPKSNYIATANQKIVLNDYPHHITNDWSLPYRQDRITQMIEAKPKHNLDTNIHIQLDQYSLFVKNNKDKIVTILNAANIDDDNAPLYKHAVGRLDAWDGNGSVNSVEKLIFSAFIRQLQLDTLKETPIKGAKTNYLFLKKIIDNDPAYKAWCNSSEEGYLKCESWIQSSFNTTVQQLEQKFGSDLNDWQWGKMHISKSKHRIFDKVPVLNQLFNINVPVGGGAHSVNVASYGRPNPDNFDQAFINGHGPSLRHIFDLSDLEKSKYMHSTGQSGNIFSKHYRNYNEKWARGEYLPLVMKKENYMPNNIGTLTLSPK